MLVLLNEDEGVNEERLVDVKITNNECATVSAGGIPSENTTSPKNENENEKEKRK